MQTETITDSFDNGARHSVTRVGRAYVYACDDSRATIDAIASKARKVPDWADRRAPASQAATREALQAIGYACETRYNAAHGRAYDLCAYPAGNVEARRVTMAAQSGMSDTNPEKARPIF